MDAAEYERFKQALALQGTRVGQHEKTLNEIVDSLHRLNTSFSELSTRLDQVSAGLAAAHPPPTQAQAPPAQVPVAASPDVQPAVPREPFIPTPARFSGEIGLCGQFLHQCMLVFDQQPLTYSTDKAKVAFIMSLLSGKASAWAVALVNSRSPVCNTLDTFANEMRRVFDHPLQSKEASSRLLSLRQGNSSVSSYSIDFRILAAETGWDERALQGVFFRGLSEEIKDQLAARDETSTLEELISIAIRLDNRLAERRRERVVRRSVPTLYPPQTRQPPSAAHPPPEPSPAAPPSPTVPAPTSEEPMQLGRMRLSPEERQRRLRLGLCMYCGQAGHIVALCPTRPKEQARQPVGGRW